MRDDDKVFAWLDGELEGAEAAEIAARVDSDPELAAIADRHRAMQARLKGAFDKVAAAPIPERIRAAASVDRSNVVDLGVRRDRARRAIPAIPQWAMIAATLVLGLFVGTQLPGHGDSPVQMRNGALYAAADLDRALDTQLASAPTAGPIRIGLTFRNSDGTVCRSFAGTAATGLACHDDGRWRLRGLFPASEGQSGEYRMAAGMDPNLAALVGSTMAGEPMDAAQERQASEHGWR